jgi:hypothetical protein
MRMSVCFLPCKIKEATILKKNTTHYRFVQPIQLFINLNKIKIYDVICYLMSSCFSLNAFGYNKKKNEFWGKKINKESCFLQFNLQINEEKNNSSSIIISPIVGTEKDFLKIIEIFNECIFVYDKSYQ